MSKLQVQVEAGRGPARIPVRGDRVRHIEKGWLGTVLSVRLPDMVMVHSDSFYGRQNCMPDCIELIADTATSYPSVCYVAAPYAAASLDRVSLNVDRAKLLARALAQAGWVPVVPHVLLPALYGHESTVDAPAGPDVRERALAASISLIDLVAASPNSRLFLLTQSSALSQGMALELERWILLRHRSSVTSYTWAHVESLISSLPDDDIRSDLRRDFCRLTEDGDLDHV
jgi:hypothetical protein